MDSKNIIYTKLEGFIRKYYTNEVIRGTILFTALGLLYFIFTLLVEYFLWLSPAGRTALFWAYIAVEAVLLLRFILFPIFKLFKLQKGIGYKEASAIIGSHFTEVNDRLTNFLQLSTEPQQSELLLASIEQKANALQPVPFTGAVNFRKNVKYLPYAAIPVLVILFFMISGNSGVFTQSFDRVVNYDKQYTPPAPFEFVVLNNPLMAQQGNDFTLQVKTVGNVIPEDAKILIGDENYYLESSAPGTFTYRFEKPAKDIEFRLAANNVTSVPFQLNVVEVPTIANFEMVLNFPGYLGKKQEVVQGTGNAIVPEGTKVTWRVNALATTNVSIAEGKNTSCFSNNDNVFTFSKSISQNTDYQIITSNNKIKGYEKLNYRITTVKDQYPGITVQAAPDSLQLKKQVVLGQVSDDYGLTKLQVVYYPQGSPDNTKAKLLPVKREAVDRFYYTFPSGLSLQEGVNYEYYFEVFDNDAVHGFKSAKSSVFSHRELTQNEQQDKTLQEQNSNINSLEKSIKNQDKQISEMEKLRRLGKEKSSMDFKDQKKVEDFINRQKQQDEMMKDFTKRLNENLEQFNPEQKDAFKEELQQRLKKQEQQAEENKKLLDELKDLTNKLKEEELFEKIDQFKQKAKNQTKNLEQLVELTKRFYVEKKAEQLADKLKELGEKQEKLSESNDNSAEKQEQINKEFDQLQKEMRDLEKQNEELKKPMDIPSDQKQEESIEEDMKQASDELKKEQTDSKQKAKPKQKNAAEKMKQMGGKMMQMMQGGDMEMLNEDIKMLRQILDNLLAYSFSQEEVMNRFKNGSSKLAAFSQYLKKQQDLRLQFRHVDDSIFALSLRNPRISEEMTAEVGNVHYYIDKALEDLAENQVSRGVASQQYAETSANKLADMLSDMLNSMQMEMQGSGMGQGKGKGNEGMQLPDIIKKQEGLGEKMKKGMKEGGSEGKDKPGQQGQPGEGQKGEGEGSGSEGMAGEVLDIYKEQQQLREALQRALEKEGMGGNGQSTLRQMKDIEKQLLNKGFNQNTLEKMQNLKHELLKLDKAMKQQGEENKRESQTNRKDYNAENGEIPEALKDYLNSIEILNREALPLRPVYNKKVQTYFKTND